MEDFETRAKLHRERAEEFLAHAEVALHSHTREMYLRMAETEEALAERVEGLWRRRVSQKGQASGKATRVTPVPENLGDPANDPKTGDAGEDPNVTPDR